jgi:lipopolysaccharide transport system ATP-binding protein
VGESVTLRVDVKVNALIDQLVLGYGIRDRLGQTVYGTNTALQGAALKDVPAGSNIRFEMQFPANIGAGSYSIQTALTSSKTHLKNTEWLNWRSS